MKEDILPFVRPAYYKVPRCFHDADSLTQTYRSSQREDSEEPKEDILPFVRPAYYKVLHACPIYPLSVPILRCFRCFPALRR